MKELNELITKIRNTKDYENLNTILGKELGGLMYKLVDGADKVNKERYYHESDIISRLKYKLEVNAGMLAEPLLKQGKQPKDDKDCHKAFLVLAHLAEIEDYVNSLK